MGWVNCAAIESFFVETEISLIRLLIYNYFHSLISSISLLILIWRRVVIRHGRINGILNHSLCPPTPPSPIPAAQHLPSSTRPRRWLPPPSRSLRPQLPPVYTGWRISTIRLLTSNKLFCIKKSKHYFVYTSFHCFKVQMIDLLNLFM